MAGISIDLYLKGAVSKKKKKKKELLALLATMVEIQLGSCVWCARNGPLVAGLAQRLLFGVSVVRNKSEYSFSCYNISKSDHENRSAVP